MRDLVISYATKGREDYPEMMKKLITSSKLLECDKRFYTPAYTSHDDVECINEVCDMTIPYKFKYDLIQKAIDDGYERIWWLDSSMNIQRNIFDLFTLSPIVCFHNLGHPLRKYISDDCARRLGATLNEQQIWGGALGFDFTRYRTKEIWKRITDSFECFKEGGSIRPEFIAHRHDQATLSVIFEQEGIKPLPYGMIVCKPHDMTKEYSSAYYIVYGK